MKTVLSLQFDYTVSVDADGFKKKVEEALMYLNTLLPGDPGGGIMDKLAQEVIRDKSHNNSQVALNVKIVTPSAGDLSLSVNRCVIESEDLEGFDV